MNQFSKHIKNNKLTTIFIMVVFMFLSSVSGYGQEIASANTNEISNEAKQTNVSTSSSNMNFVLWFMGSNQDPNNTISTDGNNTKKKIITSGIAPNRLLIKAFLKKAVNFESALS